jgi:hypothetical protein
MSQKFAFTGSWTLVVRQRWLTLGQPPHYVHTLAIVIVTPNGVDETVLSQDASRLNRTNLYFGIDVKVRGLE